MTTKAPQDTGIGEVDAEKQERDDGGAGAARRNY
jgi:hypothetical protein